MAPSSLEQRDLPAVSWTATSAAVANASHKQYVTDEIHLLYAHLCNVSTTAGASRIRLQKIEYRMLALKKQLVETTRQNAVYVKQAEADAVYRKQLEMIIARHWISALESHQSALWSSQSQRELRSASTVAEHREHADGR